MTVSKDFVVHMVATPALSTEAEEGQDVNTQRKQWLSVDAIDEQYITNHARQVVIVDAHYLHHVPIETRP